MLSYAILFLCLSILFLIGAFSVYVKTSKELYWVSRGENYERRLVGPRDRVYA